MDQLSGLDASFLYLETENAPMHIGGLSILDPRTPKGPLTFEAFKEFMASRLHVTRTFKERLVEVPLQLGRPYWVEDEAFDLDHHLERTQLPSPGGWKEICALTAWELGQHLDRSRPLWKMLYVEGLNTLEGAPPGSVGIIGRVHHAAIDGVSGAQILGALFDLTPEPRVIPAPARRPPPPMPGKLDLLGRATRNLLRTPKELPRTVSQTVGGLAKSTAARLIRRAEPPPFPFTAPRTRWNVPITKSRVWSASLLSLGAIREAKAKVGCTVNDVVLTVCAGALRRYLSEKDELPKKPLVAMVPVSVRAEEQDGGMGNQVSAMLVKLATHVEDPLERLQAIQEASNRSKMYNRAIGAKTLSDSSHFIPFSVAGIAARLYTRMNLAERHRPIFNLVITNVPGPQAPLYVNGARLLAHAGAAPIFDGMGLILPIFSYAGALTIGALSTREIMPDIGDLSDYFKHALIELEEALP